jgi:hypothetical protein
VTTHATVKQYRYRIADLDGTVHELVLSSAGVTGESMFPHEQAERWRYELRTGGVTVFTGTDLTTPRYTLPDKAAASAMFFLTIQPGETDTGHFDGYTSAQLAWCQDHADSLGAAVDALQEAPGGLGACRIAQAVPESPDARVLRSGDLTRALHQIGLGDSVRTTAADRNVFRVRMPAADAERLQLTGSAARWDRVGAWLSALTETPVDITAADVTEVPCTSERWAYVTVRPSVCADRDLAEAVRTDHPCDDRSCDVAVALEHGYPQVAASLLLGATDAPAVEALVSMGRAVVPADLSRCRDWEEWTDFHSRYGQRCPSCGGYTYGSEDCTPQECGECRGALGGSPGACAPPGDEAAAVRRASRAMEEDWETSGGGATWKAPAPFVPDPVSGLGNLGLRLPDSAGRELAGDTPYRAALGALDTYASAAAANVQAAENLEAQLTVYGFDRDRALMSHIAALREAAAELQSHARSARLGLFMRHAGGAEYHADGRDAAASAFRAGAR